MNWIEDKIEGKVLADARVFYAGFIGRLQVIK